MAILESTKNIKREIKRNLTKETHDQYFAARIAIGLIDWMIGDATIEHGTKNPHLNLMFSYNSFIDTRRRFDTSVDTIKQVFDNVLRVYELCKAHIMQPKAPTVAPGAELAPGAESDGD